MKRLLSFALVCAVVLSGCNKAPGVATDSKPETRNTVPAVVQKAPVPAPAAPTTPVAFAPETRSPVTTQDVPLLDQINQENIKVVSAVTPSIVRISSIKQLDPRMQFSRNDLLPFQFHFGPGLPGMHSFPQNDVSFGSGVIISKDGYIVTNNHVIEDADQVHVQLQDKSSYTARVIASDALVDVAVLKIDASNLPPIAWGDSDKVQVGEQVFAIGNPFDLEGSVSKGIVSAKGRNMEESRHYEDYIQTDAAINPGNSGGALINIHGELIGISAAIASTTRYNMGVGFAIPSNLVRYAVNGLLKEGKLVRGYLGVSLPPEIEDDVLSNLGIQKNQGALIAGVQIGSPADQAKLRSGDFITEVDGHQVNSSGDLRLIVAQIPVGKDVQVKYIRDGAPQSTQVKIAEVPQMVQKESSGLDDSDDNGEQMPAPTPRPSTAHTVLDGIQVTDLDDKTRQKIGMTHMNGGGVVVGNVQSGSPAEAKGLQRGDVIESICINRGSTLEISNAKEFNDVVKGLKPKEGVVLLVHQGKASNFVYLAPPQ